MSRAFIDASNEYLAAFRAPNFFFTPLSASDRMVDTYTGIAKCTIEFTEFIRKQTVAFGTRESRW